MRIIKNDMARVIVLALMDYDKLPDKDNPYVTQMVKTHSKESLTRLHKQAMAIINDRVRDGRYDKEVTA